MSDVPIGLLSALRELAEVAAKIATSNVGYNPKYVSSFLLPRPFFKGEVFETLEVGWGICLATERGELFRFDINVDNISSRALDVRQILRVFMTPLVESFGGIIEDAPEGLVILSGNHSAIKADRHLAFPLVGRPGGNHE